MAARLLIGDTRAMLRTLEPESVHCCVTSPPYWGLRSYGTEPQVWGEPEGGCEHVWATERTERPNANGGPSEKQDSNAGSRVAEYTDRATYSDFCQRCQAWRGELGLEPSIDLFVTHVVEVFREVRRVLRRDGTLWLNIGDSYAQGGQRATPQELEADKERAQANGYHTEAFSGYRGWDRAAGTAGNGLKQKDLCLVPERLAIALQEDGWYVRSRLPWIKRSAMPESISDRPSTALEYVFLLTRESRYYYDADAVRRQGAYPAGTRAAKGSEARRAEAGVNGRPPEYAVYSGTRNFRNTDLFFESLKEPHGLLTDADGGPLALDVNPAGFAEAHFATYPPRLITPLILAGTSEKGCCPHCGAGWRRVVEHGEPRRMGGDAGVSTPHANGPMDRGGKGQWDEGHMPMTRDRRTTGWQPSCSCPHTEDDLTGAVVLDPFCGSGTTGVVALKHGRRFIGIELQEEYAAMARRRLDGERNLFTALLDQPSLPLEA